MEDIRQRYAPDKRVALFAVEAGLTSTGLVLRGETNLPLAKGELTSRLLRAGYTVVDSLVLLPAAALQGQTFALVRQSVANIRSQPKHSAEMATQALLGTPLRLYKYEGDWALVQTPDGYLGWLDTGGFAPLDSIALHRWRESDRVIVTADYSNALTEPSPTALPVGDLVAGNMLEQTERRAAFTGVRYPDGRTGYVPTADVSPLDQWLDTRHPNRDSLFRTAYRFLGRPYLWGGTSGKGMDCSGFTKMVYFLNGFILPRDASQQVHAGTDVPTDTTTLSGLQPGDFLFFGNYRDDGTERVTHVGIYLGEGRFIHAGADNGAVRIQSLRRGDADFAGHRLQTFLRARRLGPGTPGVVRWADSAWYF